MALSLRPPWWWPRVRRAVRARRRPVAAASAALAVLSGVAALRAPPAPTVSVWAAARDLGAGQVLRTADLRPLALPVEAVPAGAIAPGTALAGRVVAGPVRAGEPFTDVRLVGAGLLRGYGGGVVAAPVRLADADVVALVRPGDLVDVLAAAGPDDLAAGGPPSRQARRVATAVRVITVPRAGADRDSSALVLLATSDTDARTLAQAGATMRLSIVLRSD